MADAKAEVRVGSRVRILSIGDWLMKDLLPHERQGILSCVGKVMTVTEIDKWGGIWVGFGETTDEGDSNRYVGQSFVVEPGRIEIVDG